MSLTLKGATRDEDGRLHATYGVKHSGPKTVLDLDLEVLIDTRFARPPVAVAMTVETPPLATMEESLDMLADWLERAAAGIRSRSKEGLVLPLYDNRR